MSVRFLPDTWLDVLMRPVAMAAPDANVYVEPMAPDFRFVFALVLLALLAVLALRRRAPAEAGGRRPVLLLLTVVAVGFVPWLATTGNGRYFAAGLLLIGPVCVGLACLLPVTRALRLTLAVAMVGWQGFAVHQSAPWHAWSLAPWKETPYFQMEVPPGERATPATYLTLSAISYSLLAPQFHPGSRWMSLHNAPPPNGGHPDARRTETFLAGAEAGTMMLLVPVVAGMLTEEKLPNTRVSEAFDQQLAPFRLALAQPRSCRFLASRSLADMGLVAKTPEQRERSGFWLCHLVRIEANAAPGATRSPRYDAVFRVLETQCPRHFPAGGDRGTLVLANGEMRSYQQAEMKAYVYDSGEVYYKYYRALNPVLVGQARDVLEGRARVDCSRVRGRSGLPWNREI